jgi:tRNA dimethylallyltransferase
MILPRNTSNISTSIPILFLLGPTASGKTNLAMEFVKQVPAEIISVDSAMVYRGLNIGTGKPTAEELEKAPHHLIDIRDPKDPYSAAEFCHDAFQLIQEIRSRDRIPLLVGGTMLYFRSLLQGLSPLPSADPIVRARLLKEAENIGWKAMHDRLNSLDPKAALRIHSNDPQRIQRALEIYELTGKPQSELWESSQDDTLQANTLLNEINEVAKIFVVLPKNRALLHERIEQRFHLMLQQGFMNEVQALYRGVQAGELQLSLPALRSVGYRQALQYLASEYSYDEMVNRAIAATRQLAKRQITWLRGLFNLASPQDQKGPDQERQLHLLDIENNHLDSLKSMIHSVTERGVRVKSP